MAAARKRFSIGVALVVLLSLLMASSTAQAVMWLNGKAPDWNQPNAYQTPNGPWLGPGNPPVVAWQAWCAPTSASNMVGYWEDARGSAIADGQAFPNSPAWATTAAWHDYNADGTAGRPARAAAPPPAPNPTDIGWYMDTNDGGTLARANGFDNHVGTYVKDMHIGIADYINTRAPGWLQSMAVGGVKTQGRAGQVPDVAYTSDPLRYPAASHPGTMSAWNEICQEIQLNHPVIVSWNEWMLQAAGHTLVGSGPGTQESSYGGTFYNWQTIGGGFFPHIDSGSGEYWNGYDNGEGLGHATLAVGYIVAGSPDDYTGNTNWVIVHDNWGSTPRNVIVPFDPLQGVGGWAHWDANTTMAPEPCGWIMILTGGLAFWLIARRRRMTA
jgi:hypothetical protein